MGFNSVFEGLNRIILFAHIGYFTMCFHAIFTTNRIQQLVFVKDMQCVYCDVWINILNII